MWDLPRPGLQPVSPALAGGFFNQCATREALFPELLEWDGIWKSFSSATGLRFLCVVYIYGNLSLGCPGSVPLPSCALEFLFSSFLFVPIVFNLDPSQQPLLVSFVSGGSWGGTSPASTGALAAALSVFLALGPLHWLGIRKGKAPFSVREVLKMACSFQRIPVGYLESSCSRIFFLYLTGARTRQDLWLVDRRSLRTCILGPWDIFSFRFVTNSHGLLSLLSSYFILFILKV